MTRDDRGRPRRRARGPRPRGRLRQDPGALGHRPRRRPGEFVTIIGANGAGKTTLLRALTGLIPSAPARPRALGVPLGASAAVVVRGGVGHVPEGRQLFPLMTVRENLDAGADYLPAAKANAERNRSFVYELFPRLRERAGSSPAPSRAASARWWPSAAR
jgi:ABC-type branched-subunit amino acid transport system ATPase component